MRSGLDGNNLTPSWEWRNQDFSPMGDTSGGGYCAVDDCWRILPVSWLYDPYLRRLVLTVEGNNGSLGGDGP